jgi:RNA-splicing ligase RtcB
MQLNQLVQKTETEWLIEPRGTMRVPGVLYASEPRIREMEIHCGRGLEHQVGTDFLGRMVGHLSEFHLSIPDRELVCVKG